jgi:hypothetical protein
MRHSPELSPIVPEIIDASARKFGTPGAEERDQKAADRVYQFLTVAAMVLLLASLWVF